MTDRQIQQLINACAFGALAGFVACSASADPPPTNAGPIAAAIREAVAPNGQPRAWCARIGGAARCASYVDAIAEGFAESAARHDVDAWTLVGMASVESGFNPLAQGGAGELGIMQHHPRWHPTLGMIRHGRAACMRRADICQREAIDRAARSLARRVRLCRDPRVAVSGHNAGRCSRTPKARRYARRVFARRAALMGGVL